MPHLSPTMAARYIRSVSASRRKHEGWWSGELRVDENEDENEDGGTKMEMRNYKVLCTK